METKKTRSEKFGDFANWAYANWLPIVVVPFGLIWLSIFTYTFVTQPPQEVLRAQELERERLSSELVKEIESFEFPPPTKLIEFGEYTRWKDYIYIDAKYETELSKSAFLEGSIAMLDSNGWKVIERINDRGMETHSFRRRGIELQLTFYPPGILRTNKIGRWGIIVLSRDH